MGVYRTCAVTTSASLTCLGNNAWDHLEDGIVFRTEAVDVSELTSGVVRLAEIISVGRHPNALAFYGERGTLHLSDDRLEYFDLATARWQELPVPAQVTASLPQVDNSVPRDWNQLCREFVADVQDDEDAGYPTFHKGLVAQ